MPWTPRILIAADPTTFYLYNLKATFHFLFPSFIVWACAIKMKYSSQAPWERHICSNIFDSTIYRL